MIYYDLEIFEKMCLAGFLKENGDAGIFVTAEGLKPQLIDQGKTKIFINQDKISKTLNQSKFLDQLVGFNNHHYDDFIIGAVLDGNVQKAYELSQDIIARHKHFKHSKDFATYDTREQLPVNVSLKKYESMRGLPVEESSIPFDKSDRFTLDEVLEVVHYNLQDLFATRDLFHTRNDDAHGKYFDSKKLLVQEYGWSPNARNFSNGSMAASYLMGWDKLKNLRPAEPKIIGVSEQVATFLKRALKDSPYVSEGLTRKERAKRREEKAPTELYEESYGNVYKWAWGGLHSAVGHLEKTPGGAEVPVYDKLDIENVYQLDVTSMFPNIIIRDALLGPATDTFSNLVSERVENKIKKLPVAKAQKIVINSVYGLLRLPSSKLFNGHCAIHVNVSGMVAVYALCTMLYNGGAKIIQTNTDGVAFQLQSLSKDDMEKIRQEWEKKFGLKLELSHFKRFIQKDVNNYIGVKDDKKLKLKGGMVAQAEHRDPLKASTPTILQTMLVEYLVNGTPALTTLNNCNELLPFTFTLSSPAGQTQTGYTVDADGNRLPQKVNRVYCATHGSEYFKERREGNHAKFSGVSDSVKLVNGDAQQDTRPADLDIAYYLKLFQKNLAQWVAK